MTRFGRWLRNLLERWLGTFYEGPQPPRHLAEEVRVWRAMNPRSTPADWERFAAHFARACYERGFTRGYEWQERGWPGPEFDPEHLAEIEAQDWSLAESNEAARELMEQVSEDPFGVLPQEQALHYFQNAGVRDGTHRVILLRDERNRRK